MPDFMAWGMGVLRWPPDVFWHSTPHEVLAGIDGFAISRGGNNKRVDKDEIMEAIKSVPHRGKSIKAINGND